MQVVEAGLLNAHLRTYHHSETHTVCISEQGVGDPFFLQVYERGKEPDKAYRILNEQSKPCKLYCELVAPEFAIFRVPKSVTHNSYIWFGFASKEAHYFGFRGKARWVMDSRKRIFMSNGTIYAVGPYIDGEILKMGTIAYFPEGINRFAMTAWPWPHVLLDFDGSNNYAMSDPESVMRGREAKLYQLSTGEADVGDPVFCTLPTVNSQFRAIMVYNISLANDNAYYHEVAGHVFHTAPTFPGDRAPSWELFCDDALTRIDDGNGGDWCAKIKSVFEARRRAEGAAVKVETECFLQIHSAARHYAILVVRRQFALHESQYFLFSLLIAPNIPHVSLVREVTKWHSLMYNWSQDRVELHDENSWKIEELDPMSGVEQEYKKSRSIHLSRFLSGPPRRFARAVMPLMPWGWRVEPNDD